MNTQNFAGIPDQYADRVTAKVLLQSIPYDGTSTWGKGADKGFTAFMDAAANMELYDIETDSEVYKHGIHLLDSSPDFGSPAEMYRYTYQQAQALLKEEKFLTFFGGEHSISIGLIKAHYEHFDNISILQIDAHADLRPSYEGTPYNHACALYDASQHAHLVQVGIRSMDASEKEIMDTDNVFFASDIHGHESWINEVVSKLHDIVYITFDLDAFDPAICPGTGTPEPGGMAWYSTLRLLRSVFAQRTVVGFDIVELAPIEGHSASQFLAAKLYYKMLSYKFNLNQKS